MEGSTLPLASVVEWTLLRGPEKGRNEKSTSSFNKNLASLEVVSRIFQPLHFRRIFGCW